MRSTRSHAFLFAGFLAAAPLAAQAPPRVIMVPGLRGVPPSELIDTMGTPREVPFPAARVFAALEKIYAELKVKPEVYSKPEQIGNQAFYARGSFAGRRMSAMLECGAGMSGPYADGYRIYMGLVSFVTPTPGNTSVVRTVLVGNAINVTEGVRPTQRCRSVGELEAKIHEMLVKELTKNE